MKPRTIALSVAEQAMNSLATLAMTAAVIRVSDAEGFGQFAFVFTLVMIAASLQYGLVGIPLLVEVSPLEAEARDSALRSLLDFDFHYRLIASAIVAAATLSISRDPVLVAAAGVFALTYLWRESTRNALFAMGQSARATEQAAASFVVLIGALVATLTAFHWPPLAAFASSALACAVGIALCARHLVSQPVGLTRAYRSYRARFPRTGWILANQAAIEGQMRAHVVATQALRGSEQVGILEAARVLFAPLILISGACQRVMQPHLAVLIARGDISAARRMTLLCVGAIAAVAAIYCGAILLAFEPIEARLFGDRYGDLTIYAAAWATMTTLLLLNWTITGFLHAMRAFRRVAAVTTTAAISTVSLLPVMALQVPLITALAIPIAVQSIVFLILLALLAVTTRGEEATGKDMP